MRLHPTVSAAEALEVLVKEAAVAFGLPPTAALEEQLRPIAEAMAAISAVELPEDVEPAFA